MQLWEGITWELIPWNHHYPKQLAIGLGEQKWLVQLTALVEKDGSPFFLREMAIVSADATAKLLLPVTQPCTGAVT